MLRNASQEEAIAHVAGPMLVLAGPGSGKTMVITERTKNLIMNQNISPSNILVITFTKAAALEMKSRFEAQMGGTFYPVTFGTFHAVFFQILKHAYGFRRENIIRTEVKYQFIHSVIERLQVEDLPMDYEDEKEFVKELLSEISLVKNTGIILSQYDAKSCDSEVFRTIVQSYDKLMRKARLIDFDDMLVYCKELLLAREDIRKGWQEKYQYILIDEFQDVNQLQFEIIGLLAKPLNNLFVVGDDDQSIYRFRGAKPEIMLGFEKCYPQTKKVLLNINYRSVQAIVTSALQLIGNNKERYEKNIQAHRTGDLPPEICQFETQTEQNKQIIAKIQTYKENGGRYGDIAILFRTNTQPRLLMEQLITSNILFQAKDIIPNRYDHWIAKDIDAYIRLALGSRKRKDLLHIMNRPNRYVTRDCLTEEMISLPATAAYFYQRKQPWIGERVEQLARDLEIIRVLSPFAAINYIRNGIGYEGYLKEYAQYHNIGAEELEDVLEEITISSKGVRTFTEWYDQQAELKKELVRQRAGQNKSSDGVTLATLHSAKGLEFPYVFIIDVNDGIMPFKKAVLPMEQEEERRMFYVGITRAKDRLCLCYSRSINGKEMIPSCFLEEIIIAGTNKKNGAAD
jgi:DNA helicase-2/ATP-dependent DNA helicase PcrA